MQDFQYEINFLYALIFTVISEVLIALLLVRISYYKQLKHFKVNEIIGIVALASIITLPYLWFVLPAFINNKFLYHIVGELGVVFIETLLYFYMFKIGFKRSLSLSFLCNLFSYLLGIGISHF